MDRNMRGPAGLNRHASARVRKPSAHLAGCKSANRIAVCRLGGQARGNGCGGNPTTKSAGCSRHKLAQCPSHALSIRGSVGKLGKCSVAGRGGSKPSKALPATGEVGTQKSRVGRREVMGGLSVGELSRHRPPVLRRGHRAFFGPMPPPLL